MNKDLLRDLLHEALEQQLIATRTCMDALAGDNTADPERGERVYSDGTWNGLRHLASLAGDREILGMFERMEERWRDPDAHVQLLDSLRTWAVVRGLGFHHTERGFKVHDAAVPEGGLLDRARAVLAGLKQHQARYLRAIIEAPDEGLDLETIVATLWSPATSSVDPRILDNLRKIHGKVNARLEESNTEITEDAEGRRRLAFIRPE